VRFIDTIYCDSFPLTRDSKGSKRSASGLPIVQASVTMKLRPTQAHQYGHHMLKVLACSRNDKKSGLL